MANIDLENLTEEEREAVVQILKEMTENGVSNKMNDILLEDYKEIPVDIETFIHDPLYLGRGLMNAEGKFTLFPFWEDLLKRIYPDPLKPATCNTLALTGAIGIGKSTEAVIIGLYELYRMLCLKDPAVYYGIMSTDVISFAVINITLDAAAGVAWSKMQNLIQASDWFLAHGSLSKTELPSWKPHATSNIELICGSQPRHFIGRALYWAFFDEISFIPNQDVEKQKQKATELVSSATARMQSRFMRGAKNPTILVLASSKRTEQSFLETWIENKKKNESKTTIIVDEPQWVIRTDKASERTFKVAIGNKFLPSEVLPPDVTEDECQYYIERGFRLLEVPIGYYENFLDDIDIALTDIAGISTSSTSNYISGERITKAKTEEFVNPFTKDIIEVGDGLDDPTQYSDYFDLSKISPEMKEKPLFIHLDMSLTGDKTGVGGVFITGLDQGTRSDENESRQPTREMRFRLAFVVSVKAPRGHQVSFEKTRNFIYWLKEQGFRIKGVSSDTFARSGVEQDLLSKGYNYSIISVDRVNSDRVCEPYAYLKNAIYERRLLLPKKGINLLTEELIGLKRNNNNGKVDHDPSGINSKDAADSICGALWNASKNAEEYAYDYGESLDVLTNFNDNIELKEDIAKQMTEGMKEQFRQSNKQASKPLPSFMNNFLDEDISLGISDGILYW